jgi:hypothetical protein
MQTHQGNYQQQQGGSAPNMTGSGGYQSRPMSNQPSQSGPLPQQMPSQSDLVVSKSSDLPFYQI